MNDFYLYRNAWISDPHYDKRLTDSQCDALLSRGGWLVRNTYDFDQEEASNFWYIIKDSFGGMEELSTNVRTMVRKAVKCYDYKRIDKRLIEEQGFEIINAAFKSYPIKDRIMNRNVFQQYLERWDVENYEFWGAFNKTDGRLVGFSVERLFGEGCFYDLVTFRPENKHNSTYPYYGLFYTLNKYYLGERCFRYVTDGSRSITEHSNIQPFLEHKFKFRKAYCKLKIRYKWWFGIVVRILYPFRKYISNRSVKAVLMMHEMQTK